MTLSLVQRCFDVVVGGALLAVEVAEVTYYGPARLVEFTRLKIFPPRRDFTYLAGDVVICDGERCIVVSDRFARFTGSHVVFEDGGNLLSGLVSAVRRDLSSEMLFSKWGLTSLRIMTPEGDDHVMILPIRDEVSRSDVSVIRAGRVVWRPVPKRTPARALY